MASDIKHWQLNATVYKDRVEEIHYISDPARNVRRKQQREIWVVEQFLGRGGFGEVSLQKNNEAGKARAVKRIAGAGAAMNHNDFEKELKALLEFSKPKYKEAAVFVEFFGWFKDGSDVFLAMEYMPLGDLEKYVVARSGKIPEIEARDITEQIMLGLEIMHAESFAHRDLKPQNVLVVHGSPEWWVKLADFGLSKRLTDATGYHTRAGTQAYMAPEVQNLIEFGVAGSDYTNAVDMWAVGCITYRLVTGIVPFPLGRTLMKYCEDKSLFPYDALFDSGIKSTCSRFIRHLLVAQPQERPSAAQALQHEWIGASTNIERRTSFRQQAQKAQQQQAFQPSQSAISEVDYNTASHEGLKSYQSQSSDAYSSPQTNAPNINPSFASGSTTITPEALPLNPEAAAGIADGGLGKVELLHPLPSLPSKSSYAGGTWGPYGPPPPLPDGWKAEWSERYQKWQYFSTNILQPKRPQWNIPTMPLGPSEEDGAPDDGTPEGDEEEEEDIMNSEARMEEQVRARMAGRVGMPMLGPAPPKKESTPIEKRPVEEEMAFPAPPVSITPTRPEVPRPTERVVAIYTFDSDEPGDLPFTKGDVIEILGLANEHWYKGRLDMREGILPANFVDVLPVPTTVELEQLRITEVRALFHYGPTSLSVSRSSIQLPFKKYEIIKLIRPLDTFPEAWLGENTVGWQGTVLLKYVATESQYQRYVVERRKTNGRDPVEGHTEEKEAKKATPKGENVKSKGFIHSLKKFF